MHPRPRVGLRRTFARGLPIGGIAFALLIAFILFFLMLPTLIVIPMSFGTANYIEFPPSGLTLRWYLDNRAWCEAVQAEASYNRERLGL